VASGGQELIGAPVGLAQGQGGGAGLLAFGQQALPLDHQGSQAGHGGDQGLLVDGVNVGAGPVVHGQQSDQALTQADGGQHERQSAQRATGESPPRAR